MEEWKKDKIKGCICNIQDKLSAIENEINLKKPYNYYIIEKIEPIIYDAKCIKSMCESEEK